MTVLEKVPSSNNLSAFVFGKNLDNQTIAFESTEEAREKNAKLFNDAKRSVRIVTVHGKSWLRDQVVEPNFKRALKNGGVELLVVNPLSDAFRILKLSQKEGISKEDPYHQERMEIDEIRGPYNYYRDIFANHKEKSSLGYYSKFPWIRFAIYDGQHATFVLTPFLKTGTKSTIFYTSDPWLIKCLEEIFEEFKSSSKAIEDKEYENMWPQLQKKYSW
jgi:hypothetical protein